MTPISICTISKNEQKHIENYFKSISKTMGSYPYEVVLVDTGSTDDTVKLASKYVDRVHHFEWINDFSAAKNFALSLARYRFILFLDCDEYLSEADVRCFDLFSKQYPKGIGIINIKNHLTVNESETIQQDQVSRFFDKNIFHFSGPVHEQLVPLCESENIPKHVALPIAIDHYGYQGTLQELRDKVERNNALLFSMLKDNPDDPYIFYQIGAAYSMIKDYEQAYTYYGQGLEFDVDPRLRYVQEMVVGYGYSMLETGRESEALNYEGIYEEFKNLSDYLTLMGLIYLRNGLVSEAYSMFTEAVSAPESININTKDSIPKRNMEVIREYFPMHDS